MLPNVILSLKQSLSGCQVRSSPLLEEAIRLGLVVRSIKPKVEGLISPSVGGPGCECGETITRSKIKLPQGHRFFPDCLREQQARLIEWCIRTFQGDCWFMTETFKDFIPANRAWSKHNRFLSRLNQAYLEVPGAELLRSISTVEWQQREVIHFHLLIFGRQLRQLSRMRWENRWQLMSGGFCANYNAELKAAPYLAKHHIKERLDSSLYFGGSWRGINPPRSVSRCCSKSAESTHSKWHYPLNPDMVACDANVRELREVAV